MGVGLSTGGSIAWKAMAELRGEVARIHGIQFKETITNMFFLSDDLKRAVNDEGIVHLLECSDIPYVLTMPLATSLQRLYDQLNDSCKTSTSILVDALLKAHEEKVDMEWEA